MVEVVVVDLEQIAGWVGWKDVAGVQAGPVHDPAVSVVRIAFPLHY